MRLDSTEALVALVQRLQSKFAFHITTRENSWVMRVVALALSAMGVMRPRDFLQRYATTMPVPFHGTVVFLPWAYTEETDADERFSRAQLVVHEATHAWQIQQLGGTKFAVAYANPTKRVRLEVEAFGVMWAFAQALGHPPDLEDVRVVEASLQVYFPEWDAAEIQRRVRKQLLGVFTDVRAQRFRHPVLSALVRG